MTEPAERSKHILSARKPLSLIPVGLKEAALDSPPFRATVVHFTEQFSAVEAWLDGYTRAAGKLAQEVQVLESLVGTFLTTAAPPSHLSEAIIDHDYTLLAMQRYSDGAKEYWSHTLGGIKKTQSSVIDPIKNFLQYDIKSFKDARKQLETTQKHYDSTLARYYSQSKTKEPSSLREDAFQLHEARKSYLKSSMDFCVQAPSLRSALDDLLIKVFSDQWLEMKGLREASTTAFQQHGQEMTRIRGWSKEMLQSDRILKRELLLARVQIEDRASSAAQPSRELDDYAASTVPFLGNHPPSSLRPAGDIVSSRQGWLFVRILTGKPARYSWIRRWFFVKNGIFGWMSIGAKSGGVEESEKIGVLLCNVRPAFQEERRFCFEVKTKDTTLLLQAETQGDLTDWLMVFDVAKERAVEDPASTEILGADGNPTADAAFAINPAVAPELTAKEDVANILHAQEADISRSLPRHSVDVAGLRRSETKSDSEGSRDNTSRLIQKLDLHRKTTAGAQMSGTSGPSAVQTSGIASLISASHTVLPLGPNQMDNTLPARSNTPSRISSTSLAPSTLAQPPAPTNLSRTAVMISAERGIDLGLVDAGGGVPSSIMANHWGTTNYGHISRLERGEVKVQQHGRHIINGTQHRLSDPDILAKIGESSKGQSEASETFGHRKTMSEAQSTVSVHKRAMGSVFDFPRYYPDSLKAHDTQMRMLFPNISHQDRAVLVFRASWNPDERQDLPGRVFVTMNELYFYSHHYGFTLVSGIALSQVIEVSATKNGGHDYLYLQTEGRNERDQPVIVVIKTFIESVKVLQKRLRFLVSNCSAEEPAPLDQALDILINLDRRSPDDVDETEDEDDAPPPNLQRRGRAGTTTLRVDHNIFGGDSAGFDASDPIKFRLPSNPVNYAPKDMTEVAVECSFDVSAKALFHIMFGDWSAMSQTLYRDRRGLTVKQHPWSAVGESGWRRVFEYGVGGGLVQGELRVLVDTQTVDIANDHLCYVVTDVKRPWQLPYASDFSLVSKVVVTHVAKSKCLLRIFTTIEWTRQPAFFKSLVERYALQDLRLDAQDFRSLVTDQVQKLGPKCYTRKAIQIFGNIGQTTETAQITSTDPSIVGRSSRLVIHHKTLPLLILETGAVHLSTSTSGLLNLIATGTKAALTLLSGHSILTLLLAASILLNALSSTTTARTWYHDRTATDLATRLGINPHAALTRTIHLSDIDTLTTPPIALDPFVSPSSANSTAAPKNKCTSTFHRLLAAPPTDAHTHPSTRLQHTRRRMGAHRHDLLVALRLVNTLEREVVRATYERWLADEAGKCRAVGRMLAGEGEVGRGRGIDGIGREGVREWYEGYCGSCYEEVEALRASEGPGSG